MLHTLCAYVNVQTSLLLVVLLWLRVSMPFCCCLCAMCIRSRPCTVPLFVLMFIRCILNENVYNVLTVMYPPTAYLQIAIVLCIASCESMSSSKRAVNGATCPLEDAGILLHVLNSLGPGHHLFIISVSKAWRDVYEKVASVQMCGLTYVYIDEPANLYMITCSAQSSPLPAESDWLMSAVSPWTL
jgi:hypothetical protein